MATILNTVRKSFRINKKSRTKQKDVANKSEEEGAKSSPGSDFDSSLLHKTNITYHNPLYRENSMSPLSSPPSLRSPCKTPPRKNSLSFEDACRKLLPTSSGAKRKSDEENDSESCTSPVKSPRKTPRSKTDDQTTPRSSRRQSLSERKVPTSTPRRLFSQSENVLTPDKDVTSPTQSFSNLKLLSPGHPLKLQRPDAKPYQAAKHALHTAKPERLIGRDKEEEELELFITDKLDNETSSSIYISGPPGTGKTALVSHIVDRLKCHYDSLQTSVINCMMLRDSNTVFSRLYNELTGQPLKTKDSIRAMERLVTTSKSSILLVLDEIDQLGSKHHEILYRIFEWPSLKGSKVVLIGIANALDLTDRMLPRLQAAVKCKPVLMNFAPYSSTQITDILKARLEKGDIVEPSAISFCARKVASVAGDVRKALDVCRRAVEIVEADARSQQVLKTADCNSPTKKNRVPALKKVNITHISKVMANIYGSSVSSTTSGASEIPLQQKLAVCSLLMLIKSGKFKEVCLGKLYDTYVRVCKRQQTASVDQGEFYSILGLLESRGVTALKKAKDTRLVKVSLKLDEQELEQTLKDKRLMDAILKAGLELK